MSGPMLSHPARRGKTMSAATGFPACILCPSKLSAPLSAHVLWFVLSPQGGLGEKRVSARADYGIMASWQPWQGVVRPADNKGNANR